MSLAARIRRRRMPREEDEDSSSTDVSVRGQAGSLEDRRLSHEEWDERVDSINANGLQVRLVLDPLPEDPEAYDPDFQEWVDDENSEQGGYYRKKSALLGIRLVPLRDSAAAFPRLVNRRRRRGEEPYHISLCFSHELHRFDLYNRRRGVEWGMEVYTKLRDRYDGRQATLRGRVRGASLELNGQTVIRDLDSHNIVRDLDVWALHDCGEYHDRKLHVSL